MKLLKFSLVIILVVTLSACGRSEKKAKELLRQADEFAEKAALLENHNEEEALSLYRKAAAAIGQITKNYSGTTTSDIIIGEGQKIGKTSTNLLTIKVIPELQNRIEALKDPHIAAKVVAERIQDPTEKAQALALLEQSQVPEQAPAEPTRQPTPPLRESLEAAAQAYQSLTIEQRTTAPLMSLLDTANGFTQLGDVKRSSELIAEVIQQIAKLSEEHDREKLLVRVSVSLAMTGDVERTERILALIKDSEPKVNTLTKLSGALTRQGKDALALTTLQRARNLTVDIPTSETKTALLAAIRDQYLELKRFEDAFALALKLQEEDDSWRKYAREFSEKLIAMGEAERALLLGRSVKDPYLGAVILTDVAKQRISQKNQGEAVALMEEAFRLSKSGENAERTEAMREYFLEAMMQMHLPKEALTLIENNQVSKKPNWLCRVAREYAALGKKEEALSTLTIAIRAVRELGSEVDQVEALHKIGAAYTSFGAHPDEEAKAALRVVLIKMEPFTEPAATAEHL